MSHLWQHKTWKLQGCVLSDLCILTRSETGLPKCTVWAALEHLRPSREKVIEKWLQWGLLTYHGTGSVETWGGMLGGRKMKVWGLVHLLPSGTPILLVKWSSQGGRVSIQTNNPPGFPEVQQKLLRDWEMGGTENGQVRTSMGQNLQKSPGLVNRVWIGLVSTRAASSLPPFVTSSCGPALT